MSTAGAVLDDAVRLRAVAELAPAEGTREDRFDRVTRTVLRVLDSRVALLDLVTEDAVQVVSAAGTDVERVDRTGTPCSRVVHDGAPVVVPDTTADPRFGAAVVLGPLALRSYAGVPVRGPSGQVVGALCALDECARTWSASEVSALADLARWAESELAREDVVRRRAADARAVARMKDDILSLVSHELRTPLTSLQGALGLLSGGVVGPLSTSGQQLADIALASAERLVRLVDDICELERLAAGQVSVHRRAESLPAVVRPAVEAVTALAARTSVVVRQDVQPTTAWLDGARVTQVLGHLLRNAVQASGPGSEVVVRAWSSRDAVVLEVEDSGCGIPPQDLERVFGSFVRVDASDSRAHSGTGLGLALSRSVVEAHGGRLSVRSEPGSGTTFTVDLPQRSGRDGDGG